MSKNRYDILIVQTIIRYGSRLSLPQQIQSTTVDSVNHSRFSLPRIQSTTADSVYHSRFSQPQQIQSTTAVT